VFPIYGRILRKSGTNHVVQATTNLTATNWISLTTNAAPFLFTQTNASSFSQHFIAQRFGREICRKAVNRCV
jgi:hypothetical protein